MGDSSFNIGAVERDTGLSKDVLRVWERRYGFPVPQRDGNGERVYPVDQVERLRQIKRLMDQGHRPGKLLTLAPADLALLAPRRSLPRPLEAASPDLGDLDDLLGLLRQHDAPGFQEALQQRLARQGLQRFVLDTVAPLTWRVGQAWEEGRIQIFEEHLFTELSERLLRQAIAALPPGRQGPRVLLTTTPGEQHMLGLLMVEALWALEGATCIPLGSEMPLQEIVHAAAAHRVDVVALSFSVAFGQRGLPGLLAQLREMLPAGVEAWVGGSGVERIAPPAGVTRISSLVQCIDALADWRSVHGG